MKPTRILALFALAAAVATSTPAIAKDATKPRDAAVAVAPQFDTTHVYVAPDDVQYVLPQTIAHRLVPVAGAGRGSKEQVRAMIEAVALP